MKRIVLLSPDSGKDLFNASYSFYYHCYFSLFPIIAAIVIIPVIVTHFCFLSYFLLQCYYNYHNKKNVNFSMDFHSCIGLKPGIWAVGMGAFGLYSNMKVKQ